VLAVIIFTDQFMSFIWPLIATTSDDLQVLTVGVAALARPWRRQLRFVVGLGRHVAGADQHLLLHLAAAIPRPVPGRRLEAVRGAGDRSVGSDRASDRADRGRQGLGKASVLRGINLAIAPGEFIALLGPSGCGKSTLLKSDRGLEELSEGEIYVGGRLANYLKPSDRNVAMVFQNYALYPHMTVRENLGFPLKMSGVPREEVRSKVEGAATLLQLGAQLDRYPTSSPAASASAWPWDAPS
jgi:ABC-type multidrug transport system fused ATPase/permease subunit